MRILATFAASFSFAVFLAVSLLPERLLLPGASLCALLTWAVGYLLRNRPRSRRRAVLLCAGLAVGLCWTAVYTAVWFQPARELDDTTVRMTATVADWPQQTDYGWSVLVRADTDTFVALSTILYTDDQGADLRPGDRIEMVAHCTLGDRTFSGTEITYYTAKGIFLRAQAYGRLGVERPERVPVRCWPAFYAKELKASIARAFPEDAAPLITALVTGNRDNLTDAFTTSLQRTGLSHTVAVSGMHMAFLAGMVSVLLGKGKRSTAVITALLVVFFSFTAGNTPSVVRAAVMILLLQIAPLADRERDEPTALAFALMLLLLWNPFSAVHMGLQLSFSAVAGIFLVSDAIQKRMSELLRLNRRPKTWLKRQLIRVPRFLVSALSATLGASVLTVPLVAVYFQSFSLISPLSNLFTLWAVAILFVGGLTIGTIGIFSWGAASVLAIPFTVLARYLDRVVTALGRIPLASIPLNSVYYRAWVAFFCLLIGMAVIMKGRKRLPIPAGAAVVTLAASIFFTVAAFQTGEMTVAVLDVGQGQSVLIRAGNYLTLVDCGGDGPDNAGNVAADFIQSTGRTSLDLLVVSHYHTDHANGIPQLLRRLDVSAIALPDVEEDSALRREILAVAEENGAEVWFIEEDTNLYLGEEQEITLYAPLARDAGTNEIGLTVLASAGDYDVLIPGDMGSEVEELLLAHAKLPDIELLVVGHHGSAYSTSQTLLDAVRPEVAAISVGADNRYGHPAPATLTRLEAMNLEIFRTDLQGTVTIRSPEEP